MLIENLTVPTDTSEQPLWSATLRGRYHCEVKRLDEVTGILRINDLKAQRFFTSSSVSLLYGARFGADNLDIRSWLRRISRALDCAERAEGN